MEDDVKEYLKQNAVKALAVYLSAGSLLCLMPVMSNAGFIYFTFK